MSAACLGCGKQTELEVKLDFTDDVRRRIACCDECGGTTTPAMTVVLAAFKKHGAMPLNPHAEPRVCPFCNGPDERKCGCV